MPITFSKSYLHERSDNALVEYRRVFGRTGADFEMEGRVLRPDGTPYSELWFPTNAEEMTCLSNAGSDILDLLDPR